MKKLIYIFAFAVFFYSCNKIDIEPIEYPVLGYTNGVNVLYPEKYNIISYNDYCFAAKVPKNGSLKVLIKGNRNWVPTNPANNWNLDINYETNDLGTITIQNADSIAEMKVYFRDDSAKYIIEYYENGAIEPTRIKDILVRGSRIH